MARVALIADIAVQAGLGQERRQRREGGGILPVEVAMPGASWVGACAPAWPMEAARVAKAIANAEAMRGTGK